MAQQDNTSVEAADISPLEEYDAIESAVLETARGRWFLEEFARRHRVADTQTLLDAISKLGVTTSPAPTRPATETTPAPSPVAAPSGNVDLAIVEELHLQVAELSAAIELTRQEIRELGAQQAQDGGFKPGSDEISDISAHTEQAVSEILRAAEAMQASAWAAREDGTDSDICDRLDKCAIDIYTACTFQELTSQRIRKLVSLLTFTEERVEAMIQRWEGGDAQDPVEAENLSDLETREPGVEDTRPADVFAVAEDATVEPAESDTPHLFDDARMNEQELAANLDEYDGQDTFVSARSTLQNVSSRR
jgi:hypothetical protein